MVTQRTIWQVDRRERMCECVDGASPITYRKYLFGVEKELVYCTVCRRTFDASTRQEVVSGDRRSR
jgi:hypothetical protein